jgi:hypothetical protein
VNVLLYTDFHAWTRDHLEELMKILHGIKYEEIENNMILVLYNPILSFAMICEILKKIGEAKSIYTRPAKELSKALQSISHKLSENLTEDMVKTVYMDTDFRGQTLLRLVVNHDLEPLLKCQKVEELIEKLWTGKDTYE